MREAEVAKQHRVRKARAAPVRRRDVPIEQWLMTLPCEVQGRIIAVLEDAWRGLRPRPTLPQQIRRYYRSTAAVVLTPFPMDERTTRAACTAGFAAPWDRTCSRLAATGAFDRLRPQPSALGHAASGLRPFLRAFAKSPAAAGACLLPLSVPLRPS